MKTEFNPFDKKESPKTWKYIESLGKSALLALLISLGVNEAVDAQTKDKEQDKKIKNELVTKAHTIGLKIYDDLIKRNPIKPGYDGISFKDTDINEKIYFRRNYTESYLDKKEENKDIRYVDENGDGQLDRIILSEEKFKSDVEKTGEFSLLMFPEESLANQLDFSSNFGEMMKKKIKVFLFKDIDKVPRFVIYDFNDGEYGETDKEGVYDLWLKYQEKYTKSLENFSAEMHR